MSAAEPSDYSRSRDSARSEGKKSMLAGQDGPNRHSAGSFFVNPVVSAAEYTMYRAGFIVGVSASEVPAWPNADGISWRQRG